MHFITRLTRTTRSLLDWVQTRLQQWHGRERAIASAISLAPASENTAGSFAQEIMGAALPAPTPTPTLSGQATSAVRIARILLVEDTEINRQLALLMLKKRGWIVDPVVNGKLALDAIAGSRYDLILMDCMMPVMDGYEAVRQLRLQEYAAGCGHVPVIGLTASVTEGDRERCLAAGMDDYLPKPFTGAALGMMVERWLLKKDGAEKNQQ